MIIYIIKEFEYVKEILFAYHYSFAKNILVTSNEKLNYLEIEREIIRLKIL